MKVELRFFKTLSGYKGDETGFLQPTNVAIMPKEGDYFDYDESYFNQMNIKEQKEFNQFGFSVGQYYVAGIMDFRNKEFQYNIDFSIFLIQNKDD